MTKLPYMISDRSISVMVTGKMRTLDRSHANFAALSAELKKTEHDVELISELVDICTFIAKRTFGEVRISDDTVKWRDQKVGNVIALRLLAMLKAGDDLEPLSLFLGKVMENPVESARDELYLWLEAGNAPICPDGDFLAFKKVRDDYKDVYTGTIDNSVGQKPWMKREDVDPNRHNHCSRGLHFAQHQYLSSYSGARVMILKINPADVVSIPTDYKFQKGRCWKYEVVGEVENDHEQNAQHFEGVNVDRRYESAPTSENTEASQTEGDASDYLTGIELGDELTALVSGDDMITAGDFTTGKTYEVYEVCEVNGTDRQIVKLLDDSDVEQKIFVYADEWELASREPKLLPITDPADFTPSSTPRAISGDEALVAIRNGGSKPVDFSDALATAISQPQAPSPAPAAAPKPQKVFKPRFAENANPAPATAAASEETFTNKAGVSFTSKQIRAAVDAAKGSVRGAAAALGVAKSSLQDWVKRINAA